MTIKFTAIPSVTEGITPWQRMYFDAVKENLELLTGQRGDQSARAIVRGDASVDYHNNASGVLLDAPPPYGTVPTIAEFNDLVSKVNLIIQILKGSV